MGEAGRIPAKPCLKIGDMAHGSNFGNEQAPTLLLFYEHVHSSDTNFQRQYKPATKGSALLEQLMKSLTTIKTLKSKAEADLFSFGFSQPFVRTAPGFYNMHFVEDLSIHPQRLSGGFC